MKYFYRFTRAKKITERKIKMAQVSVYDELGKLIGSYAWSQMPLNSRHNRQAEVETMVNILIREHELKKILSKIEARGLKGGDLL
jgi:hypothetical protein